MTGTGKFFLYAGLVSAAVLLVGEVAFMANLCVYAFKLDVTRVGYSIPAMMLFMLVVGWLPLLLRRYTRRAFIFSLLVMTVSFAVSCMMAAVLIVGRPLPLKLTAIIITSWLAGGLCGWVIVYLDRQRWRLGERLGLMLHGFEPLNDARSRRPLLTVILVSLLAVLVCAGIWHVGRVKLWRELWHEPGYRGRLWVASNFVEFCWFYNKPAKEVHDFLGQPQQHIPIADPNEHIARWLIGIAPPGETSHHAEELAYLCVRIRDERVVSSSIEYEAGETKANDVKRTE